ncbi:MAG: tautomerase family protein [Pseudonocardia sediminis]
MPLIRIDAVAGRRTPEQLTTLLDTVHAEMVSAFGTPQRDRYQVVHEHPREHLVVQDTGLGFERTDDVLVVQVTSRPRGREAKEAFYGGLAASLQRDCGLRPEDLLVTITENTDEDWSFGHGRAQFLTGEL